jgi:diguanylate cyclase (GGDEF)-like protein
MAVSPTRRQGSRRLDPAHLAGRLGIRFHLAVGFALLVLIATLIGTYSTIVSERIERQARDQQAALQMAISRSRTVFEATASLTGLLAGLATANSSDGRRVAAGRVSDHLDVIAGQIESLSGSLARLEQLTGVVQTQRGTPVPPRTVRPEDSVQLFQGLRQAALELDREIRRLLTAREAARRRAALVRDAQRDHITAASRAEVTMRALVSRALAIDLVDAAAEARLQERIDDLLEREFSWLATAQDLVTDSRNLLRLAERILTEPSLIALADQQAELSVYARRLKVYRRLPPSVTRAPLADVTAAYAAAVLAMPSLSDLRRDQITAASKVESRLGAAHVARDALSARLFDLTRQLGDQGRELLNSRQSQYAHQQRLAHASAVAAAVLMLAMIAYYLSARVVRPVKALTEAMQRYSDDLRRVPNASLRSLELPALHRRRDEIGIMTQALSVMHGALQERESALVDSRNRLQYLAQHDALTGLPNRTLLSDRIERAVGHARRSGEQVAIALLDLDSFKSVNDRHGHGVGDDLLVAVGDRLRSALGEQDTLARLGGDEFALLMTDLADTANADELLGRVCACFSTPFELPRGRTASITASIGYTLVPPDSGPGDVLVRHADHAMYMAKRSGEGRMVRYEPGDDQEEARRQSELQRIERAFDDGRMEVHYQPIVDLDEGRVVGAEALLRWWDPVRGFIDPVNLLPLVQGTELANRLGSWVLDRALAQAACWDTGGRPFLISVNVAAEQLHDDTVAREVRDLLRRYRAQPGQRGGTSHPLQLQLEIVETSALGDIEHVARVLGRCQREGARIALDDFGTGYASLTYVRRLPIDTLKIDRSFIAGMLENGEDRDIVRGMIALAAVLGRDIVAEGVETEAQAHALLVDGCCHVQGFGIARPMPAEAFAAWLRTWPSSDIARLMARRPHRRRSAPG